MNNITNRLSDADYETAVKRVAEYDKQVAAGERIVNESTLEVAEELARLFEDGRWFDELTAERESKPKGRGRPVERSSFAFGRWLRARHAQHVQPRQTMKLLGAHKTVSEYLGRGPVIPTSEYQVRPLYRLTSTGRGQYVPDVWAAAVEMAGGQPTREQVAQAVRDWWDKHVPKSQRQAEDKQRKAERLRIRIQSEIRELLKLDATADAVQVAKFLAAELRGHKGKAA